MLLIVTDENDYSSHEVIDWLDFYEVDFYRLNNSSNVEIEQLVLNNDYIDWSLKLTDSFGNIHALSLSQITSYWYRRGYINYSGIQYLSSFSRKMNFGINSYLNSVWSEMAHP